MKLVIWSSILFMVAGLSAQAQTPPIPSKPATPAVITYRITVVANGSFGYDIFSRERRLIRQTTRPGLPGQEGFRNKADAEKVARLVVDKLKRHIVPPSVSLREMDSLHIKYKR